MDETECTETSTHKIQRPGNHPEKEHNIQIMAKVWNREKWLIVWKTNIYFTSCCFLLDSASEKYYVNCKI